MLADMFGKLTLEAFHHEMVQDISVGMAGLSGLALIGVITYFKLWKYLWTEWFTIVDPKRIGIMYITVTLMIFMKGFADALLMRTQQMLSVGDMHGILSFGHFQEVFSAHGTMMIFFVAMGFVFAFLNLIIPLQIGARDVAFPFLNAMAWNANCVRHRLYRFPRFNICFIFVCS